MMLVTGGTGFVGRHVVRRLLSRGESVACLVREGSVGRLPEGVTAIVGDITQPLDPGAFPAVDGVIHLAALYDLSADEAACRAANVDGTRHVLALCEALGATLHYISTVGIAEGFDGVFDETCFDEGQSHGHPYPRSKFDAERLVREQTAVPWRIYRPGAVVGSSIDGATDKADGLYLMFPLIRRLRGALPSWVPVLGFEGGPVPLAPVDFVAEAIVALAHASGLDGRTFHLCDADPPTLGAVGNTLASAAHAPRFAVRLDRSAFDLLPGATALLKGMGPVKRLRSKHLGGASGAGMLGLVTGRTTVDANATAAVLDGLGVVCPRFEDYTPKLWDYWDRTLRPQDALTLAGRAAGRVVLITGASSGIGRAAALAVGAAGAITLLVARSADKLQEVADLITEAGGTAHVLPCDCADPEAVDALVARVEADFGGVHVLVNNAGRSIRRGIANTRFHDFERTISLNYLGALRLTLGFLPTMRARGDGHVVNVLTMGLQTRVPRFSAYLGSKAALEAATASIGAEVLSEGVHFTQVYMPLVRTPMIAPTDVYKAFPSLSPEEGAALVTDAITRRPIRVSTGLGSLSMVWRVLAPKAGLAILSRGMKLVPEDGTRSTEPKSERSSLIPKILGAFHW